MDFMLRSLKLVSAKEVAPSSGRSKSALTTFKSPFGKKLSVRIYHPKEGLRKETGTQTDYRESEAQTDPWSPEVVFWSRGHGTRIAPECLPLGTTKSLTFEEALRIERSRQKEAWESSLPKSVSKKAELVRLSCVKAIAWNEINFGEALLLKEHKERLQLSKNQLKESREKMLNQLETRLDNRRKDKSRRNESLIEYWKRQLKRKIRKLRVENLLLTKKLLKIEVLRLDSALPEAPDTWDTYSDDILTMAATENTEASTVSRYLAEFSGIDLIEKHVTLSTKSAFQTRKRWADSGKLCSRIVKKAEKEFEKLELDEEGKCAKDCVEDLGESYLRKRRFAPKFRKSPREIWKIEEDEKAQQCSLLLARIVKGRAVQTKIFSDFIQKKAAPERKGSRKSLKT